MAYIDKLRTRTDVPGLSMSGAVSLEISSISPFLLQQLCTIVADKVLSTHSRSFGLILVARSTILGSFDFVPSKETLSPISRTISYHCRFFFLLPVRYRVKSLVVLLIHILLRFRTNVAALFVSCTNTYQLSLLSNVSGFNAISYYFRPHFHCLTSYGVLTSVGAKRQNNM